MSICQAVDDTGLPPTYIQVYKNMDPLWIEVQLEKKNLDFFFFCTLFINEFWFMPIEVRAFY